MVKIIIAGSRSFENYPLLEQTRDEFIASLDPKKSVEIVSGGARGADRLGEKYARSRGYALMIFPALSAMRVFHTFRQVTICSAVIAVASSALGIIISIIFSSPVGATIVVVDLLVFGVFGLAGKMLKK